MGLFQRRGSRRPARYCEALGPSTELLGSAGSPHATLEVSWLAVIRTRCATRPCFLASVLTTLAQAEDYFFARIAPYSPLLHCQARDALCCELTTARLRCRGKKRAPKPHSQRPVLPNF